MAEFLVRRTLQSLLVLFLVSLATFGLIHAAPGGPITVFIKPNQSPEIAKIQIQRLGLDKPVHVQYVNWLRRTLQGDFGTTFKANRPVSALLWPALKNTVILMAVQWVLTMLIGIPWGIYNSTRQYGLSDNFAAVLGYAGFALPTFWFGIMLQEYFALKLHWLPLSGINTIGHAGEFADTVRHMVLPVLTLTIVNVANYLKYSRASMLEVLSQDYVRTARAKGVAEKRVIFRHALRNALIPIVTIMGIDLPVIVAGAALTETVFNWPGMGRLFVDMANAREYSVLMAIAMVTAVMVVLGNLLADILYMLVDPRVQVGGKGASA